MYPSFLCPNCRAVTDLDAEIDDPYQFEGWEDEISGAQSDDAASAEQSTAEQTGSVVPLQKHAKGPSAISTTGSTSQITGNATSTAAGTSNPNETSEWVS
jgi:hypothetical protein